MKARANLWLSEFASDAASDEEVVLIVRTAPLGYGSELP